MDTLKAIHALPVLCHRATSCSATSDGFSGPKTTKLGELEAVRPATDALLTLQSVSYDKRTAHGHPMNHSGGKGKIMKLVRRMLLGLAVVLAICGLMSVSLAAEPTPKHVRLLAIGNSFSQNATHYLPGIVEAAGDKLTFRTISIGGCPLERHWKNADAFQHGSTEKLPAAWTALSAEPWDFITLQQYSMHSFKLETYRPYAKQLYDYIKRQCPKSEVLIHETWAYREDDPLFKNSFSQQDMYWGLRGAYEAIAGDLGCRVLPVGDAFENARRDAAWKGVFPDPKFDAKTAKPPALPDQTHSLNRGYSWSDQKLKFDGHHANTAGEYLGAAVWFEFMFGHSIVGNSFVPRGLTAPDVAILQKIAHQTVTDGLKPKK